VKSFTWYADHPKIGDIHITITRGSKIVELFSPQAARKILGRKATPFECFELFLGPLGALNDRVRKEATIITHAPKDIFNILRKSHSRQIKLLGDENGEQELMTEEDDNKLNEWVIAAWDSGGVLQTDDALP
jgi:hypothetical protein